MGVLEIHKIERLINLVLLIKNQPGIKVKEIANIFETSKRTIYRDFNTLSLAGFPVYSAPGRVGGYFLTPGYFLPPLRFTCEEAASLLISAKLFLNQKGFPYQEHIQLALAKLESTLGTENRQYIKKIDKMISISLGKLKDYQEYSDIFQKLNQAILEKRQIEIDYYTITRNKLTKRIVDPLHLMFREGFWYLIAFCHWRKEIKIFRIDRIQSITLADKTFEVPSNFSLSSYMGKSWRVVRGDGKPKIVEIKIFPPASRWVKEEMRHPTQEIIPLADEAILFKVEVTSFIEIKKWILQMGSCAQVLEPQELKEEIIKEIEEMRERYKDKLLVR